MLPTLHGCVRDSVLDSVAYGHGYLPSTERVENSLALNLGCNVDCIDQFLVGWHPIDISEPQPISWGSISQGIPLFSTKTMPVRAARLSMRGLPPWGLGGSGGRSGSMVSHSSSATSSLAMFSCYPLNGFVRLT